MTKIRRETVADQATAELRHRIVTNQLRQGTAVTEEAMADELGVSRSTMRQVINSLLLEGLLTRHSSTRVVQVTTLGEEDVLDIYRARRFLELGGVDAAVDATPAALGELATATTGLKQAVADNDHEAFAQADTRCHEAVVGFLGSQALSETHTRLMSRLSLVITRLHVDNEDLTESLEAHERFASCVLRGQLEQARSNLAERLAIAQADVLHQVRSSH